MDATVQDIMKRTSTEFSWVCENKDYVAALCCYKLAQFYCTENSVSNTSADNIFATAVLNITQS